MPVPPSEDIVRAICTDKIDGEDISPSLFKGANTSVSRTALIPLEDHWDLFRSHVQRPPQRMLEKIGEIRVERLQAIGQSHADRPTELTVEPKPEPWNHAHAEIPQNISRGLASKIVKALCLHSPPANKR